MKNIFQRLILLQLLLLGFTISKAQKKTISLHNDLINIEWELTENGWQLSNLERKADETGTFVSFGTPDGEYTLLYSSTAPNNKRGMVIIENGDTIQILDKNHSQGTRPMVAQRATSGVVMNQVGKTKFFYPTEMKSDVDGISFETDIEYGKYIAKYSLDKDYHHDILLTIKFTASVDGYYSLASPTLSRVSEEELKWGIVPGYFQGNSIQPDFTLAYTYAQGLPRYPILCRESTITTLCSIISCQNGFSLGVIPSPGQSRHPYPNDENKHDAAWKIGLSHMNRKSELSPTAYHPVLGEEGSFLRKNEEITFNIRYSLQNGDWYNVYKHTIYNVYQLEKSLQLKKTDQSLSERVLSLFDYVLDDSISMWKVAPYKNTLQIGAQRYAGAVKGSKNDAMKNSDVAAVWMLAEVTQDEKLKRERLPYIRNFKVAQQETDQGFFHGAARGQYYLWKSQEFKEEWGSFYEPIGLTYYTLEDIGNILLFTPDDMELKRLLRSGADRLLEWQKPDGSFVVAYDKETQKPIYTDLRDLRPTFYGFVIAYKILGDKKYLEAAEKGASWFIANAVNKGHFLGVCGDYRYINDFATGQSGQALLDLYGVTKKKIYLDAAISTARMYTTSIYTHPIPSEEDRFVNNKKWKDWQLSQVGLSFEHGGSVGSAVLHGPILLASHAGFFMRMYMITRDPLFRDLARAGVLGRDAFVHPDTRVASYYWSRFDLGAGSFPQHTWWQIGWIMDYLVSEAEMRTNARVSFPRGFCTPKVGAHQTLGFAPGKIDGLDVNLVMRKNLVRIDNSNIDYIAAETLDKKKLFVIVLNSQNHSCDVKVKIDLSNTGSVKLGVEERMLSLEPFGAEIITIEK